jgi:glycosyltransferase involved in cell wall biosynthesis
MLSLLTFTTLFPNESQPNHGIFVENRLRHLVATGQAAATVLAPVAWFPGRPGQASPPFCEHRCRLEVLHPRFLAIPGLGMAVSPWLLYLAAARVLAGMLRAGARFDAIDAHYFYPDGVAAIWLGRRFGLPVVITARGSDVTQFPAYAVPRRLILRAAAEAAAIITVSAGLRGALMDLGVAGDKITVLRNGVDLAVFRPQDQAVVRRALGVGPKTLVSVGALIPRKGHDRTIGALALLPGWHLVIAGEGPDRSRLEALARRLGVGARVVFLGAVPHRDLPALFSAADLSVLASSREGWANVLLESMACGTPVIASPIAGTTEVVQSRAAGLIARENSADGIAEAIRAWQSSPADRAATRAYAERFSWSETSAGQLKIFAGLLRPHPAARHEK